MVNLRNRAESLKVDVEAGFSNDRPFSIAVTRTDIEIGRHSISSIPAGSGPLLQVSALQEAMRFTPEPGQFHYNVKIDGGFSGCLQHLVQNRQVGSLSDMTNVCVLPGL